MLACDNSGIKVNEQFAEVGKLITHAKGGQRKIVDYKLTRAETVHEAGVITDKEFAIFQNAGYVGLYGGETVEDIHKRKRICFWMNDYIESLKCSLQVDTLFRLLAPLGYTLSIKAVK